MSGCALLAFIMDCILRRAQGWCAVQVFDLIGMSQKRHRVVGLPRHSPFQLLWVRLEYKMGVFKLALVCQRASRNGLVACWLVQGGWNGYSGQLRRH